MSSRNESSIICESAENGDGVCENCKQTHSVSESLYDAIMATLAGKDLGDAQQVQAIALAALTAVEVVATKDNIILANELFVTIVNEWTHRIVKSQTLELKNTNTVANVIRGNKTVN